MESFIKYLGGKRKEIPKFEEYIPDEFDRYIEPCVGGGSLFFYLEKENSWINDINKDLIQLYIDIKYNGDLIREELNKLITVYNNFDMEHKSKMFYDIRCMFNGTLSSNYKRSTLYIFLNKTAFSGLYRVNSKGLYNTPFGKYNHISKNIILDEHINLLKNTDITNLNYIDVFNGSNERDFMFLDPPYDTKFTEYGNDDKWTEEDHRKFAQDFINLSCKSMIIINRTDLTVELYGKYIKDSYCKSYVVNSTTRLSEHGTEHIIVCNY